MTVSTNWQTHTLYTEKDFEGYTAADIEMSSVYERVMDQGHSICKYCDAVENELNLTPCTNVHVYKIHERVKQARKQGGYSCTKAAQQMGVSRGVLENIELKRVLDIRPLYINLFCNALGVNRVWLLEGTNVPMFKEDVGTELKRVLNNIEHEGSEVLKELVILLHNLPKEDLEALYRLLDR